MTKPLPLTEPTDVLLADVAIRVQLSKTNYNNAVGRYRAVNDWVERDDSPLSNHTQLFYPQGSMAIGATVASRLKTDEFDIDVVAQLDLPLNLPPRQALALLYQAIKGEPGSCYYQMTKRRTRCVTVQYGDGMHLDVTPAVRLWNTPERESVIFHHRPEMPHESGHQLAANPYGFAEWFKQNTPHDQDFADSFETKTNEYEWQVLGEAANDPVPPHEPPFRKSTAVIVLQLLKRWRNVQYDARTERKPPSIIIAKLVADAPCNADCLSEQLLLHAKHMLSVFRECQSGKRLIHIVNPVCSNDVLTDRWPRSEQDQNLFIDDLSVLVANLERLDRGCDLEEMGIIMTSMFGEGLAKETITAFNRRVGTGVRDGRSRYRPGLGGLVIPGAVTGIGTVAPSVSQATRPHRFFGNEECK